MQITSKQKHRYILTGMPGSGKTTLINSLAEFGNHVIQEAATDIIKVEQNVGNLEPWNSHDFIEKIILLQRKRQLDADNSYCAQEFYDRSPICTYALALYLGFETSNLNYLNQEINRIQKDKIYDNHVFFIENLGFIENTDARKITFEDALKFEQMHLSAYTKFGYKCIKVPRLNIEDRVDFIFTTLQYGFNDIG